VEETDVKELSLVVPCYNEGKTIAKNLMEMILFLERRGMSFEIVVGNDGSIDETEEIVRQLMVTKQCLKMVSVREHRGKGAILSDAFQQTEGEILAFIDADLEIAIDHLPNMLQRLNEGYHICVGSKMTSSDSSADRKLRRRMATVGYNLLVRVFLNSNLSDHQAGLKVFRREALLSVLPFVSNKGWGWDTEVLVRSQNRGYTVAELPVTACYQRESNINMVKNSWEMAKNVILLWLEGLRVKTNSRIGER
jgi:glycosyltransferase involved in cell wall biosynthesis